MPEDVITENVTDVAAKPVPKNKSKSDKAYPKKLGKPTKVGENDFEFTGRVGIINVKGAGLNSNQFRFNLIGKKGELKSFILNPADPVGFSAMANLLVAASRSGAKVKVNSVTNASGLSFASELEVRAKN